ncbi:phosphotransferase [Pedobacter metabolipauper]|uniref:Phosphotransferase family enzyme n=1 Tax=Pedobacter metabolipauper TaxID=425513 RepID=A0A4V3D1F7_9SPHI|nr:phosphotransferase [Pedobacter metabolipauper]TDQ11013.1 phosphotransferase family enzyme [Pedobacter metabolipauper]
MNSQENKTLLTKVQEMEKLAFKNEAPDMSIVHEIAEELKALPKTRRNFFYDYVEGLKNRLFKFGIGSDFLDLNSFQLAVEEQEASALPQPLIPVEAISKVSAIQNNEVIQIKGYKETFIELINHLQDELKSIKGYFFLQLQRNEKAHYAPLILHDDKCFYHSIKKKLQSVVENCECHSLEVYKKQIEEGSSVNENNAVLLILSTKINDKTFLDEVKSSLDYIISSYDDYSFITLKPTEELKKTDFITNNDKTSFLAEIEFVTSTFLTNADLSNEEEKLVKSLFKHIKSSPILEYKILKGGKSGSKVLEIKPKLNFNNEIAKRYVTKFGRKDGNEKIKREMEAYSEHIENYATGLYDSAHYQETSSMEGMKYSYASKDAVQASFSYATILENSENKFYSERANTIEKLFDLQPFNMWQASIEKGQFSVRELYERFIVPEKFIKAVMKVKCLTEQEVEDTELIKTFKEVFEYKLETNKKVCHGDLHSENFFIDSNGIYLIDFGFTGTLHSLVDHTALECSIKFKHIPFYVDIETLVNIENQLTSDDSFNPSFQAICPRKDVEDYFEIINKIRVKSSSGLSVNPSSRLEYLISLFVMTCRQVQYSDLNQLYALNSAEIIGQRIKQLIAK